MKNHTRRIMALVLMTVLCAGCGVVDPNSADTSSIKAVTAKLPEESASDSEIWSSWRDETQSLEVKNGSTISFDLKTIPQFLLNDDNENRIYSPINVFLGLAMLAEASDGDTRTELLNLLGYEDVEALRQYAKALWNLNYEKSDKGTITLANSVWMDDSLKYNDNLLKAYSEEYYASGFSGEMGSSAMNAMMQKWINENTGDELRNEVSELSSSPESVMNLLSTLYFKSFWSDKFDERWTKTETFHGEHGDSDVEMMNQRHEGTYCDTDKYTMVSIGTASHAHMYFYLPKGDVTVSDLVRDESLIKSIDGTASFKSGEHCDIEMYIPKFEIHSTLQLRKGLQNLGVKKVFDHAQANLSNLFSDENKMPAYLDDARHAAMVKIDEEGVTGAAYVEMMAATDSGIEPRKVEFRLDKPFMYAITSHAGSLLFVGTVYDL